jgi:outer membrane protein OmpA-like peptidoglycan-associated protein
VPPRLQNAGAGALSDQGPPSRAKPAPARKPKRPRPTFDDGALTRTFKFPSKTYPRSSYYVTSTEIIIRIKKARKKWKLIIPKKRVVSYRTNRWFAKPRWIAIELTFTQAVKLGLAEARAPQLDAVPAIVAAHPEPAAQTEPAVTETVTNATLMAADAPLSASVEVPFESAEPEPQDEPGDAFRIEDDGADDLHVAADQDEPESEPEAEPEPELESPPPARLVPDEEIVAPPAEAAVETQAPVVVALADRKQPAGAAARGPLRRGIFTLAAAATGFVVWAAFEGALLKSPSDCASGVPGTECAGSIVTGSIDPGGAAETVAAVEVLPSTAANKSDVAAGGLATPTDAGSTVVSVDDEKPGLASRPEVATGADTIVVIDRDIAMPQVPPVFASAALSVAPERASETTPAVCETLAATGRDLQITFDYGSAQLDPATRAAIEDFAGKLTACPARGVAIEGHTDSDGRADRNRTLSLRRAEAVQKVLVAAGISADRLSAAGFGQTRPLLPNVSAKNKRNNRRAVLVVSGAR